MLRPLSTGSTLANQGKQSQGHRSDWLLSRIGLYKRGTGCLSQPSDSRQSTDHNHRVSIQLYRFNTLFFSDNLTIMARIFIAIITLH